MPNLIAIAQDACINCRYTRMKCQACRSVCPVALDSSDELGMNCSDCGLCISVCPADAITSENYSANGFERLLCEPGTVRLACRRRQEDSEWPCLGFLSERLLLALAYSPEATGRPIIIDSAGCAACNASVFKHIDDIIGETNILLRALGKKTIAVLAPGEKNDFRPKAVSRRQFFSHLFGAAVTTVTEVMAPGLRGKSRLPRLVWFDQYAKPSIDSGVAVQQQVFKSLTISQACDGCGICAGICHRKALTVQIDGHVLQMSHDPLVCVDCGVCVEHCPHAAIKMCTVETLNKRMAHIAELPVCRDCGMHFQPVGGHSICMDCLLKAKLQVIW